MESFEHFILDAQSRSKWFICTGMRKGTNEIHPASNLRVNKSLKSLRVYLLEFLGPWASAVESHLSL